MSTVAYNPRVTPQGPRLREAPTVYETTLKNKSYRKSPIGQQVGRFIRALRWSDYSQHTLDSYETTLSRLALDHDDWDGVDAFCSPVGKEYVRDFLDRHWGTAAPMTRAQRLAAVKSFFVWAVGEGFAPYSPVADIKPPKGATAAQERVAYPVTVLLQLVRRQHALRDQCALQLLCRMALRKDELRNLRVGEIDLARNLIVVNGKGSQRRVMPLEFQTLRDDLYLHMQAAERHPDEYLIFPRGHKRRPMDPASVHRWFKRCLERAGLPVTIKTHEMRHSAADHMWRGTGDIVKAQQLLRHASVKTTQEYLHPTRQDLADGMRVLDKGWQG